MDYKEELNKLKKHRKQYHPVMAGIMDMHDHLNQAEFPIIITALKEMLIICELLDIGYLDPNALIVKKKFDDITGVLYNGEYPLTEKGELFFIQNK